MTSDIVRKLFEDQERLRKLTNPLGDLEKLVNPIASTLAEIAVSQSAVDTVRQNALPPKLLAEIYGSSSIARLMEDTKKRRKMLEGPLSEARRIGLLDPDSDFRKTLSAATEARRVYESAFRLPVKNELSTLIEEATAASSIATALAKELHGTNSLRAAMESMTRPWLHIDHASTSASAFAELVSIGQNVARMRPFETALVAGLRPNLGDWRDPMSVDEAALINPLSRSELYLERGVDPALTDFPTAAFHESISIAGLVADDEVEEPADEGDEFVRAERAFAQLRRFEVALRAFIVEVMEDAFGDRWMKQQLPKDMRDKWEAKRRAEIDAGRDPRALIEYADFSDYRMIIERSDNWKTAFKSVFRRPEDVRESLQRLSPIRIATMHSRIVTLDDELLLMVETRRVLKAIRLSSQ